MVEWLIALNGRGYLENPPYNLSENRTVSTPPFERAKAVFPC
jgi:hypothetical protein